MTFSLSDLKTKRASMDRAPWSFDVPEPPAALEIIGQFEE